MGRTSFVLCCITCLVSVCIGAPEPRSTYRAGESEETRSSDKDDLGLWFEPIPGWKIKLYNSELSVKYDPQSTGRTFSGEDAAETRANKEKKKKRKKKKKKMENGSEKDKPEEKPAEEIGEPEYHYALDKHSVGSKKSKRMPILSRIGSMAMMIPVALQFISLPMTLGSLKMSLLRSIFVAKMAIVMMVIHALMKAGGPSTIIVKPPKEYHEHFYHQPFEEPTANAGWINT